MKLPILRLLRTRAQRELATFQDAAVSALYRTDSSIVLHGGTGIWRCYGGSRFSNDIDIYLESKEHMDKIKESISKIAIDYGISMVRAKDTGHLVFFELASGELRLKVEVNYQKSGIRPIVNRFENVDSTYTEVRTLSAEDFVLEKIAAYKDRRFIRDMYDIYILSDHVPESSSIKKEALAFLDTIEDPADAGVLRTLIYSGPVPSFANMIEHARGRFA